MAMTTVAQRLDAVLVSRGLAESRSRAQALVAAGLVAVDGTVASSAASRVAASSSVEVLGRDHPWASRGGLKLEAAVEHFGVPIAGRVCLDTGASTGGFTDVLLSRGASLVYAVDVGRGQLDPRLAADPRVVVLDRTNARHLTALPGPQPSLLTLDLSFISLRAVLPTLLGVSDRPADALALFKPQFEVGRAAVGSGGIVRDEAAAVAALQGFVTWVQAELAGEVPQAPLASPVRGAKGNQEYLVHMRFSSEAAA